MYTIFILIINSNAKHYESIEKCAHTHTKYRQQNIDTRHSLDEEKINKRNRRKIQHQFVWSRSRKKRNQPSMLRSVHLFTHWAGDRSAWSVCQPSNENDTSLKMEPKEFQIQCTCVWSGFASDSKINFITPTWSLIHPSFRFHPSYSCHRVGGDLNSCTQSIDCDSYAYNVCTWRK